MGVGGPSNHLITNFYQYSHIIINYFTKQVNQVIKITVIEYQTIMKYLVKKLTLYFPETSGNFQIQCYSTNE